MKQVLSTHLEYKHIPRRADGVFFTFQRALCAIFLIYVYENPDSRVEAIAAAEQMLKDFVAENADVEQDALPEFHKIIETFGMTTNDAGEQVLNELGAKAMARYQSIIDSLENAENTVDSNRIYSLTSDQNQIKFDLVILGVYKDMGLIDASVNPASMTPQQVADIINNINLTDAQRTEYANKFIDNIIGNSELFELTPPKMLADAYTFTKGQLVKRPEDKNLSKRFKTLAQKETAISKAGYARKLWESVAATLTKNTRKELAAVEQKDKLTELIVQEVLQQSENSK